MTCSKCGARNPEDSVYCNKCGNKIESYSTSYDSPQIQAKSKNTVMVAAIAGAFLVLGVAAMLLLVNVEKPTDTKKSTSSPENFLDKKEVLR